MFVSESQKLIYKSVFDFLSYYIIRFTFSWAIIKTFQTVHKKIKQALSWQL